MTGVQTCALPIFDGLRIAALTLVHVEKHIELAQPGGLLLKFPGMGELLSQFLLRSPHLAVEVFQLLARLVKAFGYPFDGVLDARQTEC